MTSNHQEQWNSSDLCREVQESDSSQYVLEGEDLGWSAMWLQLSSESPLGNHLE